MKMVCKFCCKEGFQTLSLDACYSSPHGKHEFLPVPDSSEEENKRRLCEQQTLDRKRRNFLVLIQNGNLEEIKSVLRNGEFDVNDLLFVEPVYFGECNLATEYLRRVISIDAIDTEGKTWLIHAAESGDEHRLARLLDFGANINYQRRADGRNALMIAAASGNVAIVQRLLEKGAQP